MKLVVGNRKRNFDVAEIKTTIAREDRRRNRPVAGTRRRREIRCMPSRLDGIGRHPPTNRLLDVIALLAET